MSERHQFTVAAEGAGDRLDLFLSRCLPDLSRARAQRLIEQGHVRVIGETAKPSLRLAIGAVVAVEVPAPAPLDLQPEAIPLAVAYEDRDLIVIDKPAGMPVHPGAGHDTGTVVHAVLHHCPDIEGIGDALRPGIVHRLDMDTSGLLVVAKNGMAQHALSRQMAERTARKQYLALAQGHAPEEATIDAPIGRHPGQRRQMAVIAEGRPARTHIRSVGPVGPDTLLVARLETGRTHQIRVHLAAIGHPIVGDAVYGRRSDLVPRQFLHAWRLGFSHPRTGEWLQFEAPLPEDLISGLRLALARAGALDVNAAIDTLLRAAARETGAED